MEWTRYTIHTTEAAEDMIGYMLSELGIIGVEIEDKVPVSAEENGGYFGDVVPEMPENDHLAEISFYLKKSPLREEPGRAKAPGKNGGGAEAEGMSGDGAAGIAGTSGDGAAGAAGTSGGEAGGAEGTSGDGAGGAAGTSGGEAGGAEGTSGDGAGGAPGMSGGEALPAASGTLPKKEQRAAGPVISEDYDPGTGPILRSGESESDRREREILQADPEEVLAKVRAGLAEIAEYCDIGEGTITASVTGEEDWVNNWKQFFHQFTVSGVRIVPSWEEENADAEADVVLHIDPGTAFGTGAHESTRLAIAGLRKYMKPGDRVLDIGTGSGILGMLAAKLGASRVFATDLDPNVPAALEENLSKNAICRENFGFVLGDIASDPATQAAAGEGYDLVLANIIAEILARITPQVPAHIKKGGIYITSGILITHADLVRDALREAGFTILEETPMGEWMSIAARKD